MNKDVDSEGLDVPDCLAGCLCCPLCYVPAAIASWAAPDRFEVGPCLFCLGRYLSLGKSGDDAMVLCCGDVRDIEGNPPGYWVFEGATSSEV